MIICTETEKCSKCGQEADIFCGDCLTWHCLVCYEQEFDEDF